MARARARERAGGRLGTVAGVYVEGVATASTTRCAGPGTSADSSANRPIGAFEAGPFDAGTVGTCAVHSRTVSARAVSARTGDTRTGALA